MYKIMFSIPVHEKPEVVFDMIINYHHFNPEAGIVIHIAKKFNYMNSRYNEDTFINALKDFDFVYINSNHVRTGYGDIIQAHLSNFRFISEIKSFDYFALGSSNDLFIKEGLTEYISNYDACLKIIPIDEDITWIAAYKAKTDVDLKNMLLELHASVGDICRSQVEGAVFKFELFRKMERCISKYYDYTTIDMKKLYAREEVYFPTLVVQLVSRDKIKQDNYTYNAIDSATWTIYKKDIDRIINLNENYYCVKRIDRVLNNPVRTYVRDCIGKYRTDVERLCNDTEEYNADLLDAYEKARKKEDKKERIKLIIQNALKHIKPIRDYIGTHKTRA